MDEGDQLLERVGAGIRAIRESQGLSQEVLAEKSHLHRTYVGDVERGRRNISLKSLHKIAKALGVSVGQLLET